jgi:hypothetical protein
MYSDGNHYEVEHVQPDVHGTSEMSAAPIPLNQQPTPAKPKNEPRLLPGDIIEPSPPSILEGESSGGKSAQSRKPTKLEVTSFAQAPKKLAEAPKKVSAQSASGRRKLTTHRR